MQKKKKIVHEDAKVWNFTWEMSTTLEVKNHSDPPAGPSYWVFCRPEWVFLGKKNLSSKVSVLYIVGKLTEIWWKANKRVGSENGLVTSYSRSKFLKNLRKITILIPLCSWKCSCCKQSNDIHWKPLAFYIRYIWNKTNLRKSWDSKALSKNLKCEFFQSTKKWSEI